MGQYKYWITGFGGIFLAGVGSILDQASANVFVQILSVACWVFGAGLVVYTVVKTKLFD